LNFTGGESLTISEVHEAADIIKDALDPKANIIFGVAHDPSMNDEIRITLVATGFSRGKWSTAQDKEAMRRKLADLREEDKLDTPTFLRRSLPPRRRETVAAPSKAIPARPKSVTKIK
jgi:cell division protein FtsZ